MSNPPYYGSQPNQQPYPPQGGQYGVPQGYGQPQQYGQPQAYQPYGQPETFPQSGASRVQPGEPLPAPQAVGLYQPGDEQRFPYGLPPEVVAERMSAVAPASQPSAAAPNPYLPQSQPSAAAEPTQEPAPEGYQAPASVAPQAEPYAPLQDPVPTPEANPYAPPEPNPYVPASGPQPYPTYSAQQMSMPQPTGAGDTNLQPRDDERPADQGWMIELDDGREVEIHGVALLGRNPQPRPGENAQLVTIGDETRKISKTHFAVGVDERGIYLCDRGSTNGTAIENAPDDFRPCPEGEMVRLAEGQKISFGDHSLLIRRR